MSITLEDLSKLKAQLIDLGYIKQLPNYKKCSAFIEEHCKDISPFRTVDEIIYCIYKDDYPTNHLCPVCRSLAAFRKRGYWITCENCRWGYRTAKSKETCIQKYGVENPSQCIFVKNKKKETTLEHYGVENPSQSSLIQDIKKENNLQRYGVQSTSSLPEVKTKIQETNLQRYGTTSPLASSYIQEKSKATWLEKYGVENPSQSILIKDKKKISFLNHYGADHYSKTVEFKEKHKQTCLERYGAESYLQTDEFKERYKQTCLEKYGDSHFTNRDKFKETLCNQRDAFEIEQDCTSVKKLMDIYGSGWIQAASSIGIEFIQYKINSFVPNKFIPLIEKYFKEDHHFLSNIQHEVALYVQSLNIDIEEANRLVIKNPETQHNLELDIYVPEKNVAIEFNGLYWHSSNSNTPSNYHLKKTRLCEEKGIRLLHIWEDLWATKKDIYKSIIASALGVYQRRIYARNCICREISLQEYKDFLDKNHIQGAINSTLRLGLYYQNELVQVAGWGKSRFKNEEYELHRMCSALNTQVIGGFSKLIKHSELKEFISYVDRSLYNGKGYLASGFILIGETTPSYFYFSNKTGRLSRMTCQKHKLEKLLGKENYNADLTERENMINNGYYQVFDCGNFKVKYCKS